MLEQQAGNSRPRRDGIALEIPLGTLHPLAHLANEERTGAVRDGNVEWDLGVGVNPGRVASARLTITSAGDK